MDFLVYTDLLQEDSVRVNDVRDLISDFLQTNNPDVKKAYQLHDLEMQLLDGHLELTQLLNDMMSRSDVPPELTKQIKKRIEQNKRLYEEIIDYLDKADFVVTKFAHTDVPISDAVAKQCHDKTQTTANDADLAIKQFFNKHHTAFSNILQDIMGKTYTPVKVLGRGIAGQAILACTDACENCVAVKLQTWSKHTENEIKMHEIFAKHNLTLPILGYAVAHVPIVGGSKKKGDSDVAVIVMPAFDSTLDKYLETLTDLKFAKTSDGRPFQVIPKLKDLMRRIKESNLTHGDLHFGNIGIRNGDLYVLDFGRSASGDIDTLFELTQYMRSVYLLKNSAVRTELYMLLLPLFKTHYNLRKNDDPNLPDINLKQMFIPFDDLQKLVLYLLRNHALRYNLK